VISRGKTWTVLVVCTILAVGIGVFVWLRLRPEREPGPDDVKGWSAKERLEVRQVEVKEGLLTTLLIHGIDFGGQMLKPDNPLARHDPKKDLSRIATTYYHRHGPLGVVLEHFNWFGERWHAQDNTYHADARLPAALVAMTFESLQPAASLPLGPLVQCWSEPPIAVVGIMGPAVIASYLRPYQFLDFYEPSPAVIQMSLPKEGRDPSFTFAQDALERGANVRVFQGQGRQVLAEKGPDRFYQVIVIEPSRINAKPMVDLLTREAMELFLQKGCENAIVCYHISNRHYLMDGAVGEVARDLACFVMWGTDRIGSPKASSRSMAYLSDWVMVSRKPLRDRLDEPIFFKDGKRWPYREKAGLAEFGGMGHVGYWFAPQIRDAGVLRDDDWRPFEAYRLEKSK
jgi:hypothetical protein